METYPELQVVIDLHRDAFAATENGIPKTTVQIGEETASQVMIISGTDTTGLTFPDWRENLKFGLHLQSALEQLYPGLARPLSISQYRYNQHMAHGSLLIEVGCNGNTLQEALAASRFLADGLAQVILYAAPQPET